MSWLTKLMGDPNQKVLRRLQATVDEVNELEPEYAELSDQALRDKTTEFRGRYLAGETLDDLLPEAFAAVREASKRTLKQRHHDVQVLGGIVLHQGRIAEMKTGEGKTLTATMPAYLNALTGEGVHVITVNDYLARRDAAWMGQIYTFLGLTVSAITNELDLAPEERISRRKAAYAADITHGTNSEFGFDYLRDNLATTLDECVQRGLVYAIVDEVDNIFIDEARTPLIISGQAEESAELYYHFARLVPQLREGQDYTIEERTKTVSLTEDGMTKMEGLLGVENIYDPRNIQLTHYLEQAVKAQVLFKRDKDYVVRDGQVFIVDEFTGRLMQGRRYSEGLHQAIEAKENVKIERETITQATITIQNYFRMYKKLSGMTGTAETEAAEFDNIYKLDIVVTPTNRVMRRLENADVVYRTTKEKYFAVADEISRLHAEKQPVLVGTTSIEKSELLSEILKRKGVRHVVLNAKFHEKEAEIVAQAGRLGMVTIATNMAGRGTDILLGGNADFMARQDLVKRSQARAVSAAEGIISPVAGPGMVRFYYSGQEFETTQGAWEGAIANHDAAAKVEHDAVVAAGGLHILGTERHESRRVDNQLRGRAGRQGDPGASRFYLSLEDDLMRIFAREWVSTLLQRLGMEEGVPIESGMISRRIEAAQKAVETQNFESRKHILEYDDVMNKQREAVYSLRRQLMEGVDQKQLITEDYLSTILSNILDENAPEKVHVDEWKTDAIFNQIYDLFGARLENEIDIASLNRHDLGESIYERLRGRYDVKEQILGAPAMRYHERIVMLSVLDGLWKDHLLAMDHLKEGIGLRGYAQQDPLVAYKKESFEMFEGMMMRFQEDTTRHLFRMQIIGPDGTPIETAEQLANAQQAQSPALPPAEQPRNELSASPQQRTPDILSPAPQRPLVPVPTRPASTTIDALEREFHKKKQRELDQARTAGAPATNGAAPRRSGEKVGRNDECPCGSGKKYKKCHGAEA